MNLLKQIPVALALTCATLAAQAGGFVNGGFEAGNTSSWQIGGGYRYNQNAAAINASDYLAGGSLYDAGIANNHSQVVGHGLDANLGNKMADTVYSGNHALRIEDTTYGGYLSVATQKVTNYTDGNIFFAWMAVLENGGHSAAQSAVMKITLKDTTTGDTVITRTYDAGGGTDTRFSSYFNMYYTPQWQVEQLSIDASRAGHDFELLVLASDCAPTGHTGYVYLDGFGAVTPPKIDVPEPAGLALAGIALAGLAVTRRRKQA